MVCKCTVYNVPSPSPELLAHRLSSTKVVYGHIKIPNTHLDKLLSIFVMGTKKEGEEGIVQ